MYKRKSVTEFRDLRVSCSSETPFWNANRLYGHACSSIFGVKGRFPWDAAGIRQATRSFMLGCTAKAGDSSIDVLFARCGSNLFRKCGYKAEWPSVWLISWRMCCFPLQQTASLRFCGQAEDLGMGERFFVELAA